MYQPFSSGLRWRTFLHLAPYSQCHPCSVHHCSEWQLHNHMIVTWYHKDCTQIRLKCYYKYRENCWEKNSGITDAKKNWSKLLTHNAAHFYIPNSLWCAIGQYSTFMPTIIHCNISTFITGWTSQWIRDAKLHCIGCQQVVSIVFGVLHSPFFFQTFSYTCLDYF